MNTASTSSSDPGPPDVIVSQGTGPTLRSIRRSPATIHLLILAISGVAIAYTTLAGWPQRTRWLLLIVVTLLYVAGSVVALASALTRYRSALGKQVDEPAADRRMFILVLLFDFVVGAIALTRQGIRLQPG